MEKRYIVKYRRSVTSKIEDNESYNAFWKLVKEKLKGIKTVYFFPEGVYHQINFVTLQKIMSVMRFKPSRQSVSKIFSNEINSLPKTTTL